MFMTTPSAPREAFSPCIVPRLAAPHLLGAMTPARPGWPGAVAVALGQGGRAMLAGEQRAQARRIEANERTAYRSFFAVAGALHGEAEFQCHETAGVATFVSRGQPRCAVFNRVLGLGLEAALDAALLNDLHGPFREAGCGPAFELLPALIDSAEAATLRAARVRKAVSAVVLHLGAGTGLAEAAGQARARQQVAAPGPHGLWAGRASGPQRREAAEICAEVFGMPTPVRAVIEALADEPGWQLWLATIDGAPAGAALSYTHDEHGRRQAWFGWAATRPAWRGRGVKGALDDARIAAAEAAGCELISTDTALGTREAPDPSLLSLVHRGFVPAHLRATYLPVPCRAA